MDVGTPGVVSNLLGTLVGLPVSAPGIESNLLGVLVGVPVGNPRIEPTCTFPGLFSIRTFEKSVRTVSLRSFCW